MSTIRKVRFCHFSTASTVSRVVPGISLTIERSSFSSRLSSDDLPTFGRPTIAIAVSSEVSSPGSLRAGSRLHDLVEQIADPVAVLGGDLDDRLEPELVELEHPAARPLVVGLVDRHQHRRLGRPQVAGDLLVARTSPSRPSTTNTMTSAVSSAFRPWMIDQLVERILAGAEHPAGIDQPEGRFLPLGRLSNDVAGRPGDRRDDRAAGAGDAVEQGRFADVRPADQHDRWQAEGTFHGHVVSLFSTMLDSVSYSIYDSYNS